MPIAAEKSIAHTPGPWIVYDDWYVKTQSGKGSHAIVCNPLQPKISDDEHRANAKLIAAAPELLAACQLVSRWMLGGQPGPHSDSIVLEQVESAIHKAIR